MKYSTEPRFRKYVKGYGFLSFARKFGDKYRKKLIDTAAKTGIDAAKTTSKRVVKKNAKATGDLNGSKSQMLSRLPISLAQLKARNNSGKLKNEIRKLLYSFYCSKNMTKQIYNNLIKYI